MLENCYKMHYNHNMKELNLTKYKGFIFDLDGTLFDTIGIWDKADEAFITRFGAVPRKTIHIEREQFLRNNFTIDPFLAWAQHTINSYKIENITVQDAKQFRLDIVRELLQNINYKNGAAKLLNCLKNKGYKIAMATSTTDIALKIYKHENQNIKETADFENIFGEMIVTSDMVERKKPEPECYLKALQMMGLKNEECLVFEDSLTGVLSATKAGIDTCVVYDKYADADRKKLKKLTDYHINSFDEILSKLEN